MSQVSLTLKDLVQAVLPRPWEEGDNIPWNEPGFSRRMLKEHLSQDHDAASRRYPVIERHVKFIHERILRGNPSRVLDLGCGPGLYAVRLARLGHVVYGIDFSPASIQYARELAGRENARCTFEQNDIRSASFGVDFDLAMLIYGELNVFRPSDAASILRKMRAALKPGGKLLLELSTAESVARIGAEAQSWHASSGGLFSDNPHLVLQEAFWDPDARAATKRYFIIDAESGGVTRCASTYQAYSSEELRALLSGIGFEEVIFYSSLTGEEETGPAGYFWTVVAKAGGEA